MTNFRGQSQDVSGARRDLRNISTPALFLSFISLGLLPRSGTVPRGLGAAHSANRKLRMLSRNLGNSGSPANIM